jgi:CubicO group peptidase (beta-lactamase class C family)
MKHVTDKIKACLMQGVLANHFPGASFCIIEKNGHISSDYVGFKQTYPHKVKLEGHLVYDVASLTKVLVTTTLIMKLIEDQKLSLNSKVSNILNHFKHTDITIEDLLIHASGLPADIVKANQLKSKDDVFDYIYKLDLSYVKHSQVIYSDIGFILLGKIIETLYQKALDEVAHNEIFTPLQMIHSTFRPNSNNTAPTEFRNDFVFKGLLQGQVHDEKAFALNGIAGHAGLFSTAPDIAKFILAILKNEFILNRYTIDLLFKPVIQFNDNHKKMIIRSYGYDKPTINSSAGKYYNFEETILHTGFTGCNLWIDRKKGIGFVMLSNAVHPTRANKGIISYRHEVANIIYEEGGFIDEV